MVIETNEIEELFRNGDGTSLRLLMPVVYDELRRIAGALFRNEREDHTLQPTALVSEAYIRLASDGERVSWTSRAQFFAIAAHCMRQILVNHAVKRGRQKRGGGKTLIKLDESIGIPTETNLDILDLEEALQQLGRRHARQASVVTLRFFGGLTIAETAEVLAISTATVEADWAMARAWLYTRMTANG